MSWISLKDASDAIFKAKSFTRTEGPDEVVIQAVAVVDPATGAAPDSATETTLATLVTAINGLNDLLTSLDAKTTAVNTGAVIADTGLDARVDAMLTAMAALLIELQLKPDVSDTQTVAVSDIDMVTRIAIKALAKLTTTLAGLRVDCGGSAVLASIASAQTLANVTNVGTLGALTQLLGIGYNTQNGQAIQQSQLAVQCGFRRNIT